MITLCRLIVVPLLLATLAVGCVTYSPFLNAPDKPIANGNGEAGGALSGLTQTGGSGNVNLGVEGFVRYGFSDRFTLGFRTWTDDLNVGDGFSVNGFSVDGIILLSDTARPVRYALAPRALFMFEDRTLRADGLILNGLAWLPKFWLLQPYVSVGAGIGIDLDPAEGDPDLVYVAMAHAGASVELFRHLSIRSELAAVSEFDDTDGYRRWFLVPSLMAAWKF